MTLKCSRREEGAADKAQKSKKAYPATETEHSQALLKKRAPAITAGKQSLRHLKDQTNSFQIYY